MVAGGLLSVIADFAFYPDITYGFLDCDADSPGDLGDGEGGVGIGGFFRQFCDSCLFFGLLGCFGGGGVPEIKF